MKFGMISIRFHHELGIKINLSMMRTTAAAQVVYLLQCFHIFFSYKTCSPIAYSFLYSINLNCSLSAPHEKIVTQQRNYYASERITKESAKNNAQLEYFRKRKRD